MEALIIETTKCTPAVNFNPNGELTIEGRSLPEDPARFYNPILDWIQNFKGETIFLDIKMAYLNTSSSKQIFTLLSLIKDSAYIKNSTINWHSEEGDEDNYDTGQEFESMLKMKFNFLEYSEA